MTRGAVLLVAALLTLFGTPAAAQERFEATIGLWSPRENIVVASDGNGLSGTPIDLRQDAGLTDGHFPAITLAWRPAARHRIRFEYLPITYQSSATLLRDVTFTGVTYPKGAAIESTFDWKSYAVGYEYDFLLRARWSAGVVVAARQTDIQEQLTSPSSVQARRTRVPVPVAGGTVRVTPVDRLSFVIECTGFKVPNSADRHYGGHYLDAELLATFDITPGPANTQPSRNDRYRFGAQAGYRIVDVFHLGESDSATMTVKGLYVGGVVRR